MTSDDAEVVVTGSSLLHCVGMAVHRDGHEDYSLPLAEPKLAQLLDGIYDDPQAVLVSVSPQTRHTRLTLVLAGLRDRSAGGAPHNLGDRSSEAPTGRSPLILRRVRSSITPGRLLAFHVLTSRCASPIGLGLRTERGRTRASSRADHAQGRVS